VLEKQLFNIFMKNCFILLVLISTMGIFISYSLPSELNFFKIDKQIIQSAPRRLICGFRTLTNYVLTVSKALAPSWTIAQTKYVKTYTLSEKGRGVLNSKSISDFDSLLDIHLLRRHAEYYALTYCDDINKISKLNVRALDAEKLFEQHDDYKSKITYTSFSPTTRKLVFSFRGSDNIDDYFTDIRISLVNPSDDTFIRPSSSMKVHNGFWNRFKEYRNIVTNDLQKSIDFVRVKYSNVTIHDIVVVGHSLGAAWALIQVADWVASGINIKAVYLYGMPMVGNQELVDYLADIIGPDRIVRIVNGADVVPHMGGPNSAHPKKVPEVFFPPRQNEPIVCRSGTIGEFQCSANIKCEDWDANAHSELGNMSMREDFCYKTTKIPESIYDM
jgi:hypothetical protein